MKVCAFLGLWIVAALPLLAQNPVCANTPQWSTCDLVFDLAAGEDPANLELRGEFRSPDHKTYLLYAFRDGDRRYVIRWVPTESGEWAYRLTSTLKRLDGQEGMLTAMPTDAPGFVRPANVHHFVTWDNKPHLWMGTAIDGFVKLPRAEFESKVNALADQKFTHARVQLDADTDLREAADRVRYVNSKGLVADLVLGGVPLTGTDARRKYLEDIVARFASFNMTWMGLPDFEAVPQGKPVAKEIGQLIAKLDTFGHPKTSMAARTSAALSGDAWMQMFSYGTPDPNIGAVEHQFYQIPAINTGIRSRQDLWNATMNGQYPDSGGGPEMKVWAEFMAGTRYWELEPYFDLDGGRGMALEDVEYIVYVEKPGPVEVTVEDHSYDVYWINPATGERTKEKNYKGQHFTGEPPDKSHDWILHLSRDGHKESMLKSYRFTSRDGPVPVQVIETKNVPFEIASPPEGDLKIGAPVTFGLKTIRQTRATRSLLIEWTGEVAIDGQGFRVLGTGHDGTMRIPATLANKYPAVMSLRVSVLNAYGKAYAIDKVYRLVQ